MSSSPVTRPHRPRPGHKALLDAAIAIVAQRGLRGLTYRAVSHAAGVTHTLVSHHFGSRDALVSEALAASVQTLEHAAITRPGGLRDFAAELPEFIDSSENLLVFQYELTMEARRRHELMGDIQAMYSDVLEAVRGKLEQFGADPRDEAFGRVVLAAIDGLILQQLVFGDRAQTDEAITVLQELIAGRLTVAD